MNIVVAAFDAAIRAQLRARLTEAGLPAGLEAASEAALGPALATRRDGIVLTGASWPEVAPLLGRALHLQRPVAALLDDGARGASHPAFGRGAGAVLPWSVPPRALAAALATVAEGLSVVPAPRPGPLTHTASDFARLSARERDVLALVAEGLPTKEVARRLGLSPNTVKHHVAAAFRKLGARTRAEAFAAAVRRGELEI